MSYTNRWTEVTNPLAELHPAAVVAASYTSYVSLANYHRAVVVMHMGAMAGTQDLALYQATDTSGTGAKAITSKSITQLTATDDNSRVAIELQTEELDVDGGFDCIAALQTPGGTNTLELTIYGIIPRFPPAPTTNWDEVVG